jgi:hypothetical protein
MCATDSDCADHPDAYRCADSGYCVDRDGTPVRALDADGGTKPGDDHVASGGAGGSSSQSTSGAGGAGGAAGGGGTSGMVMVPPPPASLDACPASLPEPDAMCDPERDTACALGGFACSCQCQCVSNQGSGPAECFEPCNWRCQFDELDSLLTSPEVAIEIACDEATPENSAITASATITYAADPSGPPLTIDAGSGMYLEFEGIGNCTLEDAPDPAVAGPIAPGESLTVTHVNGPAKCLGGGGAIGYFCPKLCNAGARVGFTLKLSGGGAATTQYRSWFLGDGARGSLYTTHCTP